MILTSWVAKVKAALILYAGLCNGSLFVPGTPSLFAATKRQIK